MLTTAVLDKLKPLILFVLLTCSQTIAAQDSQSPVSFTEAVSAQLNATVFVSGETLYYKVICTDGVNSPTPYSRLAYAELVSAEKKPVFTHKFFLDEGSGKGDFFIPPSLPSGQYKFIAYTRWMLDQPASKLFQAEVTIINPFIASPATQNPTESTASAPQQNVGGVLLSLPAEATTRSRVNVKIQAPSQVINGNYALSVRRKDALSNLSGQIIKPQGQRFAFSGNTVHLPELRGELVTGKVVDKEGNPAPDITVALSIPGRSFALRLADTDASGRFSITLEKPYFSARTIVQVTGPNRGDYTVALDPQLHPDYSGLVFNRHKISPEFESSIREHSVASQIENAYYMHRADTLTNAGKTLPFYADAGKTFALDQFSRFPTFGETLIEVVENAYFTKKDATYSLHVREFTAGGEVDAPALVVIDGIYMEDPSELFDYPAKNIENIRVVAGTYYFGPKAFNGLIGIETKNGDYIPKVSGGFIQTSEMPRPVQPKKYFAPDYEAAPKERIPDHRMQLAWQPALQISLQETGFSFYTSDVKGTFEVVVEGVTPGGEPVYARSEFTVK